MVELSENGFRVIAIDIPPFGFSSKPVGSQEYSTLKQGKRINAFLDALKIDKAILVGHSVGSRPTIEALLQLAWWDWSEEKIRKNIPLLCSDNVEQLLAQK